MRINLYLLLAFLRLLTTCSDAYINAHHTAQAKLGGLVSLSTTSRLTMGPSATAPAGNIQLLLLEPGPAPSSCH